ncbi:uncharacterized protein LOC132197372 isoform X2 [Neocloeon triangulifer]|uniref:uncharacterized protein LOC132197372 isoform X2 n=1 Tax=Neocloeon triangulifer TaxID=2078957 RepID=UPI00286F0F11|nr:uncharacterized protein LOC132197372 isoform X2 [Neocloeon triangulifer]
MAGNIKVGVRMRPAIAREENEPLRWKVQGERRVSRFDADSQRLTNPLEFDHVFCDTATNTDIFNTLVEPLVQNAVKGFNATILAYGQTSSGKTHTMIGNAQDRGIVPLTMENIFHAIDTLPEERSFLLGVSFLEVYNEKVRDLLNPEKSDLKVFETPDGNISTDCHVEMVNTSTQMIELMDQGNKNKSIGETNMNERSSRSHTIFRITIESQGQKCDEGGVARVSQINLVDLAGSERASQTGATGQRYKEGCAINRSLLQLGNVVQKLSEDKGEFIDYRSSKLTRILQPSLSGNANIVMICNVTPFSADQTANTLLFASRASTIKLDPHLNEIMDDATLLKRHTKRIHELEKNLQEASLLKEKNQTLEKEIEKLKDMLIVSRLPPYKDRQRALRRQTWGGPAFKLTLDEQDAENETNANMLDAIRSVPVMRPLLEERKVSLPESVTVRGDDLDHSVCMSIDEFENITPFADPSGAETPPSKLRSEVASLRQQLAAKAAATPVLRERIALLERAKSPAEGTPAPQLRERIRTLEERLQAEQSEGENFRRTLELVQDELQSKTEALQAKTREFELADRPEAPGTPVAVLHDRIKQLQEMSRELPGTPPALLRKRMRALEAECAAVERELDELREFTTLERQMFVKEVHHENAQLRLSLADFEQVCRDLRKDNANLGLRNHDLGEQLDQVSAALDALTKETETNKLWNSKANEQQLLWKKELDQCRQQMTEMKNQSQDWVDEKEMLKGRYESKIRELTASLEEAWASQQARADGACQTEGDEEPSWAETSVQTDHDLEQLPASSSQVEDLQRRLVEAERRLSVASHKLEASSQTDHDDDQLLAFEQRQDREARDLHIPQQQSQEDRLRFEGMEAEVADLRLEAAQASDRAKQVEELSREAAEAARVLREEKDELIARVQRLEGEGEEARERLFFVVQEKDNLQTQLEYQQEALNFNLAELKRLKEEGREQLREAEERVRRLESQSQVFEFHHDSMTLAAASEVEQQLRDQVARLEARLAEMGLEQQRSDLSLRNHNLEEKLSETLEQIQQQGLLSELVGQLSAPSPQIEEFIARQLQELKEAKEDLVAANQSLKDQLQQKTDALSSKESIFETFAAHLKKQLQEVATEEVNTESDDLQALHEQLLAAFMTKSKAIYSDLQGEIKTLQEKLRKEKHLLEEQSEAVQVLKREEQQLVKEKELKIAELEAELEECRRAAEAVLDDSQPTMNGKELGLALQLNETRDCLEMTVAEERRLRADVAQKEQQLADLQDRAAQLEADQLGLRALLDETMKVAEAAKEQQSADKVKWEAKLEELRRQVMEAEALEVKTSEELMDKVQQLDVLAAAEAEAKRSVACLEAALAAAELQREADRREAEKALQSERLRLEQKSAKVEALRAQVVELTAAKQELQTLQGKVGELAASSAEVSAARTKLQEVGAALEAAGTRAAELEARLELAQREAEARAKFARQLEEELACVRASQDTLADASLQLPTLDARGLEQALALEAQNLRHVEAREELEAELAALRVTLSETNTTLALQADELRVDREALLRVRAEKGRVDDQLAALEEQLAKRGQQTEELRARLAAFQAELVEEGVRQDNARFEVELRLQQQIELVATLETKITETNTLLNKVGGERDVLAIRVGELREQVATLSVGRVELEEKVKEADADYEELLVAYREVEAKGRAFHAQAVRLREDKEGLEAALSAALARQDSGRLEARVAELQGQLVVARRDLSTARGELIHLRLNPHPPPDLSYKATCAELERKVAHLQKQVKELEVEATLARMKREVRPEGVECGVQTAAPRVQDSGVQVPPDNEALFDQLEGFTPASAITEAGRLYGMREQIRALTVRNEELVKDRKLFKDVLRKRLATIKSLEAQIAGRETHPGQENKTNPLAHKN